MKFKFKKKRRSGHQILREALQRAGWNADVPRFVKLTFIISVILNTILGLYLVYRYITPGEFPPVHAATVVAIAWVASFFVVLFAVWLILYVWLDLKAYRRKISVEEVLPDFLQLTAANLRAGMTPDRALWHAIRPRFGVLADEIQLVAKEVMTGKKLSLALTDFSKKYDSDMLKRAVNLLVEGIEAGGDLAEVVSKVGTNIQETRILQKEMAANIVTYVIFIGAAVMFAAPVLLALAQNLLATIGSITSSIDTGGASAQGLGLLTLSNIPLKPEEFQNFAIIMLAITSFFSAMIIAIIQKGSIQAGLRYIPIFIATSIVVFLVSLQVLSAAFSGVLL